METASFAFLSILVFGQVCCSGDSKNVTEMNCSTEISDDNMMEMVLDTLDNPPISKFLCGLELIDAALVVCHGCLGKLNCLESAIKQQLDNVEDKCCKGKCSVGLLRTICCE
ncbi:hypothetical protein L596_023237 [Steinernema carpocapsae]|uniref:Saposin B-type domain-containing protein n=1 Tax=Steinernema carpocapsae TaxID=34508 RepID=A0A4U5MD90_STECR|nr:hypothetical protein L596_023237 [Steinernema carpocapsae]